MDMSWCFGAWSAMQPGKDWPAVRVSIRTLRMENPALGGASKALMRQGVWAEWDIAQIKDVGMKTNDESRCKACRAPQATVAHHMWDCGPAAVRQEFVFWSSSATRITLEQARRNENWDP